MKFTKQQIKIMVVVNLTMLILVCSIFFLPWVTEAAPAITTPTPSTNDFEQNRSARIPPDASMAWEMNYGTSGDDVIVATFSTLNGIIIFGNKQKSDYDFLNLEGDGFVLNILANGKVDSAISYNGEISSVKMYEGGYLLCLNNALECSIILTDEYGNETKRTNLFTTAGEELIDVYINDFSPQEPIHAVLCYTDIDKNKKELKISVLNTKLEYVYHRSFVRSYSLEYIAAYSTDSGSFLFAQISTVETAITTVYKWTKTTSLDPRNIDLDPIKKYHTSTILPYGLDGFALLIYDEENYPYVVKIRSSADFTLYSLIRLQSGRAKSTRFFSDGESYYAFVYSIGDLSFLYKLDQNLDITNEITGTKDFVELSSTEPTSNGLLLGGKTSASPVVCGTNKYGVNYRKEFAANTETIFAAFAYTDGIIVVCQSSAKSLNVGDNFGGTDIWISKIMY